MNQVIIFKLNEQYFASDITCIREIGQYEEPTPMPNSDNRINGVMNLRGETIAVVNLRSCFGFNQNYPEQARVLVVKTNDQTIGFVVDEANEVCVVNDEELNALPLQKGNEVFTGILKQKNRIVTLVDFNRILDTIA